MSQAIGHDPRSPSSKAEATERFSDRICNRLSALPAAEAADQKISGVSV